MTTVRKICIAVILLLYLMAFPPLMSIYNRPGFILGIPTFIFGLILSALSMLAVTFFLYKYESKKEEEEEAAERAAAQKAKTKTEEE